MDWKQWVNLVGAILGILAALFTIPPIIFRAFRRWANEQDSRTRKTATTRLTKLEKEISEWRESSPIDKHQAMFYCFSLLSFSGMAAAFVCLTWIAYSRDSAQTGHPNIFMAAAFVLLLIVTLVSFGFGNYFKKYLPWVRESRVKEIKEQMESVRVILMKLNLKDAPLIEVKAPGPEAPIPPSSTQKLP